MAKFPQESLSFITSLHLLFVHRKLGPYSKLLKIIPKSQFLSAAVHIPLLVEIPIGILAAVGGFAKRGD